ncbi:hypothetical protein E4K65_26715 [Bradyrhizobium niftali]|uniref:Uncharacterized protein n=1 Tax=Bradyrhizobium niftali TaxID=2560055 RepID=A0A4Y9LME9_9BRAD|nr:hypothetical protein E4K65_26715 [Bradyrhizobium niftali]
MCALGRGIQYAAASRFNHRRLRVLDRPVKPGDDAECWANCLHTVIASGAKQSRVFPRRDSGLLRFARNDGA